MRLRNSTILLGECICRQRPQSAIQFLLSGHVGQSQLLELLPAHLAQDLVATATSHHCEPIVDRVTRKGQARVK